MLALSPSIGVSVFPCLRPDLAAIFSGAAVTLLAIAPIVLFVQLVGVAS